MSQQEQRENLGRLHSNSRLLLQVRGQVEKVADPATREGLIEAVNARAERFGVLTAQAEADNTPAPDISHEIDQIVVELEDIADRAGRLPQQTVKTTKTEKP